MARARGRRFPSDRQQDRPLAWWTSFSPGLVLLFFRLVRRGVEGPSVHAHIKEHGRVGWWPRRPTRGLVLTLDVLLSGQPAPIFRRHGSSPVSQAPRPPDSGATVLWAASPAAAATNGV